MTDKGESGTQQDVADGTRHTDGHRSKGLTAPIERLGIIKCVVCGVRIYDPYGVNKQKRCFDHYDRKKE